MAIEQVGEVTNITNARGDIIGEVGTKEVDHEGFRVSTLNKYYNPVIIAQVMSNRDGLIPTRAILLKQSPIWS